MLERLTWYEKGHLFITLKMQAIASQASPSTQLCFCPNPNPISSISNLMYVTNMRLLTFYSQSLYQCLQAYYAQICFSLDTTLVFFPPKTAMYNQGCGLVLLPNALCALDSCSEINQLETQSNLFSMLENIGLV